MSFEPPILVHARLLQRLGPRHWRAELPNGAPLIAHLPRERAGDEEAIERAQAPVLLELTPFDFSIGRLAESADQSADPEARKSALLEEQHLETDRN